MATTDVAAGPRGAMVETALADDVMTIRVRGGLDEDAIPELSRAVMRCGSRPGAAVVLDLGDVAFMDASGLEFIIRARRHVEKGGGSLTVSRPTPQVHRLLAICGIADLDLSPAPPAPSRAPGREWLALAADAESRMYGT